MKKQKRFFNEHSLCSMSARMVTLALMAFPLVSGSATLVAASSNHSVYAIQQDLKTRTGIVLDEKGEPVTGANVVVKGSTHGTITDLDGKFSLDVAEGAVLQISFIGYDTKEIKVNKSSFTVTLVTSSEMLEEVVAVGYSTQKKVNLTGAVENVNIKDMLSKPVGMTAEALQGVTPGLTVTHGNGAPGAGSSFRIRGVGTLGDSNPLVLIDGVEGSIDAIDANMIESISVLKDAASSAIYGSRAANGVILVTTKRSKANQKLKVDYNLYTAWQKFTNLAEPVDGYTFMSMHNECSRNEGKEPLYSEEYMKAYKTGRITDPYKYHETNWQKLLFGRAGFQHKHSVSITGGTDKLRSKAMFMYNDHTGIIKEMNYKQYVLRVNNDYTFNKYLKVQVDLGLKRSTNVSPHDAQTGGKGIFEAVIRANPLGLPRLENGRLAMTDEGYPTPYSKRFVGQDQSRYNNFDGRFTAIISPFEDLNINVSYSPQYSHSSSKKFAKPLNFYIEGSDTPANVFPDQSVLTQSEGESWKNTITATATYHKTIKSHDIFALAGFEQIDATSRSLGASRDNFPFLDYSEMNSGSVENQKNNGSSSSWALRSYFGRLNYAFASKYLFEANIRYDGSSRFASGNRWGVFPSFSAGWRINQENFMKDIKWISNLKLRASWGQLGNQNIGLYPYLTTINLSGYGYVFGGNAYDGAAITEMPNSMITWETSETSNLGLDFGFFKNKLTGSFEYYVRNTKDILLKLPIPGNIGLSANYQNAGKVRNKGWDMSLKYRDGMGDFGYSIGFVLSDVKNEIVSLKGAGPFIGGSSIKKEGYPIDSYFAYEAEGLFRTDEEVKNHAKQIGVYDKGDIMYKDQLSIDTDGDGIFDKADGTIDANDRVILGNSIPRMTFSLNLGMEYKGFDLSLYFQGIGKRDLMLTGYKTQAFNGGAVSKWQLDHWSEQNPNSDYPRLTTAPNNTAASSFWMYDGSFVRLKNLVFGYTVPKSLMEKVNIENLRIYFAGNNLFTLDHLPDGIDPESPNAATYPLTRTLSLGLNLTF